MSSWSTWSWQSRRDQGQHQPDDMLGADAYDLRMLELRPNCERCDRDLAVDDEAYICTFECTWCPECAGGFPRRACPNCGGNLERRPVRPAELLHQHPASTTRVVAGTGL